MGVQFVRFKGASGRGRAKIKKSFEKVKAQFVLKCDIYIIQ